MNQNIDSRLNTFFIITILAGIFLGWINKNSMQYVECKSENVRIPKGGLLFVIIFGIADIVYARDIPLLAILSGRRLYGEFDGLPVIHSLVVNAAIFYSSYFFYLFLESKIKIRLIQSLIPLVYLLLLFLKGATIMCLCSFVILAISKTSIYKKIFNIKTVFYVVFVTLLIAYLNGGMTNLRSQRAWNDSSLIMAVGQINDKWPTWLPTQFAWVYSYLTSPLANLNLNVIKPLAKYSVSGFVVSFLPLIISKNLFPNFGKLTENYLMYTPVLNACTGFIEASAAAGILGVYLFAILMFTFMYIISRHIRKNRRGVNSVYYSLMCTIMIFMFFYNTFRDASTSLIIYFILLDMKLSNVKFTFNRRII